MGMAQGLRREQRIIVREIRRQLEHTRILRYGGYRLHERKDFAVKPKHVTMGLARAQPNKRPVVFAIVTGMFLFGIGLPLLIAGSTSTGRDRLAMIIPGAILFSVGSFSILVSAIGGLSLGRVFLTQNTESTKPVQNPSIEVLEAVVGANTLQSQKGQANDKLMHGLASTRLAWRTTTTERRSLEMAERHRRGQCIVPRAI